MSDDQPTAGVALDQAERVMREFYLSADYDPNAERPADTVKAAIAFALRAPTDAGGAVSGYTPGIWSIAPCTGADDAEPSLTAMVEHYYRSHGMDDWRVLTDAYKTELSRLAALTSAPQVEPRRRPMEDLGNGHWVDVDPASLAAPDPVAQPSEGVREAVEEVRSLLRYARDKTNIISNARRKIGPLASQAQTASHALAKADALLASLPVQPSDQESR